MYSAKSGNIIAVRMQTGEPLHGTFIRICEIHGVKAGFIDAGIGRLVNPTIGYVGSDGQYASRTFEGEFELLNVSGNISQLDDKLMSHLHVMMCNEDYSVFGGHLFSADVGLTFEGKIAVADKAHMYRKTEPDCALPALFISQL